MFGSTLFAENACWVQARIEHEFAIPRVITAIHGHAREVDQRPGPLEFLEPITGRRAVPPHLANHTRASPGVSGEDDNFHSPPGKVLSENASQEAAAAGQNDFGFHGSSRKAV